jgi:pimeloyl-ACP methyl ester carboxylesterase
MPRTPLLLLPGTLCTGAVFKELLQPLSEHASSVTVAEFRQERSIDEMARQAARLVPANQKTSIIGFSMGGMVAIALARRYPDIVDRLALINSNSHADLPDRHEARLKTLAEARRHGLRQVVRDAMLPTYLYRQEAKHRSLILDMAEAQGIDAFAAQIEALANRPDASTALQRIEQPVLIIGSKNDPLCPPSRQQDMLRQAQKGTLVMLEDCGHFSLLERPAAVSQALIDWLAETRPIQDF